MEKNDSLLKTILNGIWLVIKWFFIIIYRFFDAIKFIFSLPLLSIASGIFTFAFILFIKPLINTLPDILNRGLVETLIAAIIFVVLKFLIFNDKLQHDYEFKHYQYIISFALTILIWLVPIYFFARDAEYAGIFLAEGKAYTFPALLYVIFYLPHMWIATITQEFTWSVGIALVINSGVFIGLSLYNVKVFFKYEE